MDSREQVLAITSAIEAYLRGKEARECLIGSIGRLVRIESVRDVPAPGMPFGAGPANALREALMIASELGLRTENRDNVIGVIHYNAGKPLLDILCHADVVTGGTGWTVTSPFEPKEIDGKLYGRGTSDDKGPLAASILALAALKKQGVALPFDVRIIVGTDEESGSEDLTHFLKEDTFAPYVFSPDAEFPVITSEKGMYRPRFEKSVRPGSMGMRLLSLSGGSSVNIVPAACTCEIARGEPSADPGYDRAQNDLGTMRAIADAVSGESGCAYEITESGGRILISASGREAHASSPCRGLNAITGMLKLLDAFCAAFPALSEDAAVASLRDLHSLMPHGDVLGEALGIAAHDETSGNLTLVLSLLSYDGETIRGRFDSRLPLSVRPETCADTVMQRLDKIGFTASGTAHPAHYVDPDAPFVRTLLGAYETYTGLKGTCRSSGGATYVHDIPGGVAFGCEMPGRDTHMHGADECVLIDDLILSAMIFSKVILDIESRNKYN